MKQFLEKNILFPLWMIFLHNYNGCTIFSRLDIKQAFHQIEVSEDCRYITTKITDILLPSGVSKSRVDLKYILARRITLDLCCRALVPFQIVEKKGFQDFLLKTKVRCREDIPSSNTLSFRALLDVHNMVEKAVVERVEAESPIVIGIMVDGWTDGHAHHPYVNMSTQYLTKDFEMRDWNLGIEPVERRQYRRQFEKLSKNAAKEA